MATVPYGVPPGDQDRGTWGTRWGKSQMTGFVDGNDLYNLLFRKKVDRKIHELDNRYPVDFY